MPRLKTNKGAAKRFRFTSSGKVKRPKANKNHNLSSKNKKRKRRLRKSALISSRDMVEIRGLLPYGN